MLSRNNYYVAHSSAWSPLCVDAQNTFPKALVCGVVPLFKGDEWMLVSGLTRAALLLH